MATSRCPPTTPGHHRRCLAFWRFLSSPSAAGVSARDHVLVSRLTKQGFPRFLFVIIYFVYYLMCDELDVGRDATLKPL